MDVRGRTPLMIANLLRNKKIKRLLVPLSAGKAAEEAPWKQVKNIHIRRSPSRV